jgi:hypothetical protein
VSGFRNYSLTKNGQLTIGQIFSPDFLAGVSGWTINKDGSAEFNNLTIRGTFLGLDFEITTAGAFFYSGTPEAGNLTVSIAAAAGTDGYGNSYPSGIASLNGGITVNLTNGTLTLTPITGGHTPGLVTSYTGELILTSPAETSGDSVAQLLVASAAAYPAASAAMVVGPSAVKVTVPVTVTGLTATNTLEVDGTNWSQAAQPAAYPAVGSPSNAGLATYCNQIVQALQAAGLMGT